MMYDSSDIILLPKVGHSSDYARLLASLDSTESAKLFYWVYRGENFGWLGGPERFNQLPDGVASPNFQERYLVSRG